MAQDRAHLNSFRVIERRAVWIASLQRIRLLPFLRAPHFEPVIHRLSFFCRQSFPGRCDDGSSPVGKHTVTVHLRKMRDVRLAPEPVGFEKLLEIERCHRSSILASRNAAVEDHAAGR